jgi:hypothetical protein
MQIYIQSTEKQTLKSIPYSDIYKTRYDNREYTKLFPSYDSTLHTITVADTEPCLTNYELYLKGEYTLGEGEYIESESIAKAVKPSSYYEWDYENLEYTISDEKLAEWQESIVDTLGAYRDTMLATGTTFEDVYTIKGRVQDSSDAMTCFITVSNGLPVTWHYSDDTGSELVSEVARMTTILTAIGTFRSSQFDRETELKAIVRAMTGEELQNFVLSETW